MAGGRAELEKLLVEEGNSCQSIDAVTLVEQIIPAFELGEHGSPAGRST